MKTSKTNTLDQSNLVKEQIEPIEFNKVLDTKYMDYTFHVMLERAIPDARDGLKPVQRRILYGMKDLNLKASGSTTKSAKVVGQVMGNYHPHGDSAIYETMVNMTQSWKARCPLTIGQGGWGSITHPSAAAYRYTECKLSKAGEAVIDDVNQSVVRYEPNYNDEHMIPTVMPSKIPNLLVNGTSGIAVGMATKIPTHNLREISTLINAYIENNGQLSIDKVLDIMPGPDFPTRGILQGQNGVRDYYETGRGTLIIDGIYTIDIDDKGRQRIVITTLPYGSSPTELVKNIEELVRDNKIEGIEDLKDLTSSKDDDSTLNIIIYISKNGNANLIANQLLKSTSLRSSFCVNSTVTVNRTIVENAPILKLIEIFINHRKEILTNRYNAELSDNISRIHILEGLIAVSTRIDEAIALIRASNNPAEASQALIIKDIVQSEDQAKAVLAITLSRLTKLEAGKLLQERDDLSKRNDWLTTILNNDKKILRLVAKETDEIAKTLGTDRLTQINFNPNDLNAEDLIPEEQCIISITKDGYIKRVPTSAYRVQNRGGKGVTNVAKVNEEAGDIFVASTHDLILFFTNTGVMFKKKGYDIPEFARTHKGVHLANLLDLASDERVAGTMRLKTLDTDGYVVMVTRGGKIKRTELREYNTSLKTKGLTAIKLTDGDEVAYVETTDGTKDIFLVTSLGKAVRYSEDNVSVTGRATQGVRAMNLSDGDGIAQLITFSSNENPDICVVTELGYGKRTNASQYRSTSGRNVKGVNTIDQVKSDRNGLIVSASTVQDGDTLIVLTKRGQILQISVEDIRSTGRGTMGVKIVKLDTNDNVSSIARVTDGLAQAEKAAEGE